MPECAASNPAVKQQYINRHFCYAQKAAVVANGLGIVRHLELFDDDFKTAHPEMQIEKRTNHPEIDKEIGDSTSLKPVFVVRQKVLCKRRQATVKEAGGNTVCAQCWHRLA